MAGCVPVLLTGLFAVCYLYDTLIKETVNALVRAF